MAEVDTSSYLKPSAPVNALDQAAKLGSLQQQQQQIQSGALTIDKQKLDLVNQRFGELAKTFIGLMQKPDLSSNDVNQHIDNQVKIGYITPEMGAQIKTQMPADGNPEKIRAKLKLDLQHAQTTMEAINTYAGSNATTNDNAVTRQGVIKSPLEGGGFVPATEQPVQLPPTQPIIGANKAPGVVGPSGPSGVRPYASPGMVAAPAPTPVPRPTGLRSNVVPPPAVTGPTGPTVAQGTEFNNRFSAAFPNAVQTGLPPGTTEATQAVATQSGKDLATDLTRAKSLQADLYPAHRVLDILKQEGPTAFGVGTDNLNTLKNAMVTWFPGSVDQKTIEGVKNFEEAKKQLVALARSSGSTGTNDQLAAAFEANPNTKMTGATIESVLKSVVALRKMQAAQTLMAVQQGIPDEKYSKWIAQNQNQFDPRAFGFDMMDRKAQIKLLQELDKDKKAYSKFERTLKFAHDAELISPEK